jgi:TRAP-type C4-dicarboxylate transport system permease small subunit
VKIFAIGVCYFLLLASIKFLDNERSTGEAFLDLFPSWYVLTIIPAVFCLIPFHLFINILKELTHYPKEGEVKAS